MPFSGKYNMHFENGVYKCKGCNAILFESNSKFDSGCGWPSFDKSVEGAIIYREDTSLNRIRTEIICSNCEGNDLAIMLKNKYMLETNGFILSQTDKQIQNSIFNKLKIFEVTNEEFRKMLNEKKSGRNKFSFVFKYK